MPERIFKLHKDCEECESPSREEHTIDYKEYKRFVADVVAEVLSALEAHTIPATAAVGGSVASDLAWSRSSACCAMAEPHVAANSYY